MSGMVFVHVCKDSDVAEGAMRLVKANGQEIVVTRVGGALHAFQNRCTHKGGALCEGALNGKAVTCPLHGAEFDVTSGKVVNVPFPPQYGTATALKTFSVKSEHGAVLVDM